MKYQGGNIGPLYVELPKGPYHSPSFIKPLDEVEFTKLRGFRSVYMYGEKAYNRIIEQQAVRGLNAFPVYSDTLFVDFDDGDSSIKRFQSILDSAGVGYELYFSGKKGHHFHVQIEPMWGSSVPWSQKMWVASLGIDTADTSIYRHTGLIRLPGTIHQDTGKKKELLLRKDGRRLEIPVIDMSEEEVYGASGDQLDLVKGCTSIHRAVVHGVIAGHRHNTLLAIAKHFMEAGLSESACYEICSVVNGHFDEPKSEEEIRQCVRRAKNWMRNGSSPLTQLQGAQG